jgi:hypothetical protein
MHRFSKPKEKLMNIQASGLGRCLVVASVCLSLTGVAWADGTAITIDGTSTYPDDVEAVQTALDDPYFDTIILNGTFEFGDGGVQITRPNVTLTGPATILGGGKQIEHPWIWWWWYAVEVAAVDTTVENLTFVGPHDSAILVHLAGSPDGHIDIAGNSVTWCAAGIAAVPETTGGDVTIGIQDNTISSCVFGVIGETNVPLTYSMDIRNNRFEGIWVDGVRAFSVSAPLKIIDNEFPNSAGNTGIWIGSWFVGGETDPEYGDNPPVDIVGNTIEIADYGTGIMVGNSVAGINNVLVKDNVLTGEAGYGALMKQPYGSNNRFVGNDLSELTSYGPQLWLLGGRDNVFVNNKLGRTEDWGFDFLPGTVFERTAATLSSSINWHPENVGTPDPVNSGNVFIANDYRATGLPGWDDMYPENAGSVLLLNFMTRFSADFSIAYEEDTTTENVIFELGKFPTVEGKKTDVCTQVLDMSNLYPDDKVPGTNDVAGWLRCEQ